MQARVGYRTYEVNVSMQSLLDYRTLFGESFLEALFAGKVDVEHLLRLMWCSLRGRRPAYLKFVKAAARDKKFTATALRFREIVLRSSSASSKSGSEGGAGDTVNELDILAMLAICGISTDIVERLPIFAVVDVISRRNDMMSTDRQSGKMRKFTRDEMKKIYG